MHATRSPPHRPGAQRCRPRLSLAGTRGLGRVLAPHLVRAGSLLPTRTLRLDLHPAYLQHPRHMLALEGVLARAGGQHRAVTYPRAGWVPELLSRLFVPRTTGREWLDGCEPRIAEVAQAEQILDRA